MHAPRLTLISNQTLNIENGHRCANTTTQIQQPKRTTDMGRHDSTSTRTPHTQDLRTDKRTPTTVTATTPATVTATTPTTVTATSQHQPASTPSTNITVRTKRQNADNNNPPPLSLTRFEGLLGQGWRRRGKCGVVPPTFASWRAARNLKGSLPLRILAPVRVRWVPAHR